MFRICCLCLLVLRAAATPFDDIEADVDSELDPFEFGQVFKSTFIPTATPSTSDSPPVKKEFYVVNVDHSLDVSMPAALDASRFRKRGKVSYRTAAGTKATLRQSELDSGELQQLHALVEAGGFYRLLLTIPDERSGLLASIPACALLASGFRDQLVLHVDHAGVLVAVEYRPQPAALATCLHWPAEDLAGLALQAQRLAAAGLPIEWNSTVVVSHGIDGAKLVKPPPAIEPGKDGEAPQPPQSFLAKYWLYLLPLGLVLLNLAGGSATEDGAATSTAGRAPAGRRRNG